MFSLFSFILFISIVLDVGEFNSLIILFLYMELFSLNEEPKDESLFLKSILFEFIVFELILFLFTKFVNP